MLPERVQEALGELVGAAKEGLLALSVGVGLGVLSELMEEEVDEVVGPKGKQIADRAAVRHGHEDGEVTLGGRRVAVEPAADADGRRRAEVPLATYRALRRSRSVVAGGAGADARRCLDPAVPAHAGAGRRGGRGQGAVDVEVGGVAQFVERTRTALAGADGAAGSRICAWR